MYRDIISWMVENHGTVGVLISLMLIAIAVLSWTVIRLWNRLSEKTDYCIEQAEKCRTCKESTEQKHAEAMEDFYDNMRHEDAQVWTRMEHVLDKTATAITDLNCKVGELIGRLGNVGS